MTRKQRNWVLDRLSCAEDNDVNRLASAMNVVAVLFPGFRRSPVGRQMLRIVDAEKKIRDGDRLAALARERQAERARRSAAEVHQTFLRGVRDALILGESYEDIAKIMNGSVEAVRNIDIEIVTAHNKRAVDEAIRDGHIKTWDERRAWLRDNGIKSCRDLAEIKVKGET